ncbi:hypothetical protein FF47_45 [Mycobacterium phage FF47]|uniref:Uncharacterized protein n=2 Tax=Mapvirus Ff47 TaxID=1920751 RepID=M4W643_9CAUD|nr:hypothetical protein FF47_45 [Mycobacterium phage FF47]AGI12315.1 hypothetical protein FF47_45 [Mycobacterium phage FF47]WKV22140.1 hypothetical protein 8UZL_00022 [Mycobacteroides phage 8UZL]
MHHYTRGTMTELHEELCADMLYSHAKEYDWISGTDVIKTNVFAEAETMEWECDLSRFWLAGTRWTKMINQYLDPDAVREWLDLIEGRTSKKNANRMILRTNTVQPRRGGRVTTRALGSCMLSLSFALEPHPQILLHSRTGYMGYLSVLDWSVAYHVGRLAAERLGLDIAAFRFVWFAESIQYHCFRTIAYPLGLESERKLFTSRCRELVKEGKLEDYPALHRNWKQYTKWLQADKEGLTYDELSTYRSSQRPRKRFHSQVRGIDYASQFTDPGDKPFSVLPSVDVKSLTLDKLGLEA